MKEKTFKHTVYMREDMPDIYGNIIDFNKIRFENEVPITKGLDNPNLDNVIGYAKLIKSNDQIEADMHLLKESVASYQKLCKSNIVIYPCICGFIKIANDSHGNRVKDEVEITSIGLTTLKNVDNKIKPFNFN